MTLEDAIYSIGIAFKNPEARVVFSTIGAGAIYSRGEIIFAFSTYKDFIDEVDRRVD
jgi:hypothetical protein